MEVVFGPAGTGPACCKADAPALRRHRQVSPYHMMPAAPCWQVQLTPGATVLKNVMQPAGLEPAPPKRPRPERGALDRSATIASLLSALPWPDISMSCGHLGRHSGQSSARPLLRCVHALSKQRDATCAYSQRVGDEVASTGRRMAAELCECSPSAARPAADSPRRLRHHSCASATCKAHTWSAHAADTSK